MYFDHAATTPLDGEILEKMLPYFSEAYGNPDSVHSYGRNARRGADGARDRIARLLSCRSSEVYFTSCGSESNSWAIKSALAANGFKRILVGSAEHHSVINCARQLEKQGLEVVFLPVNSCGKVELSTLESALTGGPALVAVMSANNEVGTLNDIPALSALAHENGSLFFTDCVQTAGKRLLPTHCADMLSFSAHKFYGPKGVGGLFIKNGVRISPLVNGGEQERGLRGGTTNTPGVVGMSFALEKAQRKMAENNAFVKELRDGFERAILSEIPDVRINGDLSDRIEGISNITFFGAEGAALLIKLDLNGIAASLGSACASGSIGASHVLTAMGMSEREALSSVRFSFGIDNTPAETQSAVEIIKRVVRDLRK